ncbi:MAG: hypothetical protein RJQ14_07045 [Marinoscillum sp.]
MQRLIGLIICSVLTMSASAQAGWNWPEDPGQFKLAQEKQAYYKLLMSTDKWNECFKTLNWLYKNTPDLHESIYQDGPKVLDNLIESGIPEARQSMLKDSILWTYDMRIKYFNNKESVIDRKAYSAFKMYYKDQAKYPLLLELYQQLFTFKAADISDFNLTPYMTLATYYHKGKPEIMTPTAVLDIHTAITNVIDTKIATGGNREKLLKEQDKIDAFLNSLGEILTCEFIELNLVPKFEQNPEDLNIAKKVFSYSLKAKCTDQPYFTKAGETVFKSDPNFSLGKALGDKYYRSEDYAKANEYYAKANQLTELPDQKFEALMGQASVAYKQGDFKKSRSMAYEALSVKPGSKEAFNLIGNLYYLSYETCKSGESRVKDRAVYFAAYEMYQKAGNSEQMESTRGQFPSIEDIFNEGYEEGKKITVDCWVNESVVIQRR